MISFGNGVSVRQSFWTDWKVFYTAKNGIFQFSDDGAVYTIWFYDLPEVYVCTIWKGIVPANVLAAYTQEQNDADKTEFEASFKPYGNLAIGYATSFRDPHVLRRFGNLTAASTSEVLLAARAYVEQASQAQRSVVSTSANDVNPGGSGAKRVRITYLNSALELMTEDVYLNGTNAVNTVATDIRFVEKFQVIKGAAAAGAIKLMTSTAGGGSEFCGIGVGTLDAFLCHHYCPAGKSGYVFSWDGSVDDETKFKLIGRATYNGDLVDENWDLINLMGIATPPSYLTFNRTLLALRYTAGAYIRITIVPNQATTTVIRGSIYLWE